jgi:hypothetical protein
MVKLLSHAYGSPMTVLAISDMAAEVLSIL